MSKNEKWIAELKKELKTFRDLAKRPVPKGVDRETWNGINAAYVAQIPVLKLMIEKAVDEVELGAT